MIRTRTIRGRDLQPRMITVIEAHDGKEKDEYLGQRLHANLPSCVHFQDYNSKARILCYDADALVMVMI